MRRVLVVDDNEENIHYLRSLLSAHNYEVGTAANGAEALELAAASPPDLIISDLLMPVMDGYSLLRRWKTDDRLRAIPFVVFTATYVGAEDEKLARTLGADAFLIKPLEPDAFMGAIGEAVQGRSREPEHAPNDAIVMREYNAVLIRKLESKMEELEQANAALRRHIEAREAVEKKLRQAEEELRHAQKMEAIGRLAGGVAHDFNNLIQVILSYAALLLMTEGAAHKEELEEIKRAAERAAELTRKLLAISRKQVLSPRVVDVDAIVRASENMLRRLLGEDLEIVVRTTSAAHVRVDPGQLEQVLMNLVVNARDAMPDGGRLTIETLRDGDDVVLRVADTGTGMDEATRSRIFEPFFTTKGNGTGLGLSTVFGIVAQSNGLIHVVTAPGEGTTFSVRLPRTQEDVIDGDRGPGVREVHPAPRRTILLVEDDDQVRRSTRAVLESVGYFVLEARDGEEALGLSADLRTPVDLLLTDWVLPKMSGRDLAERLMITRPALRAAYMSGYSTHATDLVLPKPFSAEDLVRHVRRVVG